MAFIKHEGPRIETGVVQFGDDWPGVFIRGDNAIYYAMVLRAVLAGDDHPIERNAVKCLVRLLATADAREVEAISKADGDASDLLQALTELTQSAGELLEKSPIIATKYTEILQADVVKARKAIAKAKGGIDRQTHH